MSVIERSSSSDGPVRSVGPRARVLVVVAARAAIAALTAGLTIALVSAHLAAAAPGLEEGDAEARARRGPELARAFTAALNAHDVDALVDLFGDAGAGPTVQADRYAWTRHEIRRWARQQASLNIRVDAFDYRATGHGATWDAVVRRDDWDAAGVEGLAQTHAIWVEDGQLVAFTATLADPHAAEPLGSLWRPGASPEGSAAGSFEVATRHWELLGRW